MEGGITERKHPSIGGDEPVAAVVGSCSHADYGLIQFQVPGGTPETHVEGEDTALGGDHPVPGAVLRPGHADYGPVEPGGPEGTGKATL